MFFLIVTVCCFAGGKNVTYKPSEDDFEEWMGDDLMYIDDFDDF